MKWGVTAGKKAEAGAGKAHLSFTSCGHFLHSAAVSFERSPMLRPGCAAVNLAAFSCRNSP